ncbi:DUF3168 domain-containing protein [Massilia rhizosphaerae]|uniref:DUF3168 domain-containing protein n=1 Tax=Massilia rhizosphaerae TaxID=2784389 RepID=UPI0018DE381C|nr:DUF3168 domain-containing protein [Massilia rhizosphaerae]
MTIHEAVLALLQASGDLIGFVGDRIYPDVMDEPPVYPSVTFQKVDGADARGAVSNPGLRRAVFQVSTWARSRLEVAQIAALVKTAMDRKRKVSVVGVPINDCFYDSDVDLYDPDVKIYFNHMSFTIHYREPT